jgi:predicted DNA-binding transcriptional regulator AlpA
MYETPQSLCEKLITGPELRKRLGVTDMTLWRWHHDAELNFPQPMKLRRRNYYRESDIAAWLAARRAAQSTALEQVEAR